MSVLKPGLIWLALAMLVCGGAAPELLPQVTLTSGGNVTVRNEALRAIQRGLAALEKNQHTNGWWSTPDYPAVTALALIALKGEPGGRQHLIESEAVRRGYAWLMTCIQPDGGIYRKDLANYNTAVSLVALVVRNCAEDRPVIARAREFLVGLQVDWGERGKLDHVFDGGVGYGSRTNHSDMSNTAFALEALHYSKRWLEDRGAPAGRDLNWAAAIRFLERCQNLPSHNPEPWVSDDPAERGGFVYYPGHSMAGETNLPSGRVALRSYGSISYAGLLSYIYADLQRDDPRVIAVHDWLRRHFTVEENPAMGAQGLYYYYHMMAKALSAYGADRLELADGRWVNWREQLALALIQRQRPDGTWVNDNGRWWENDPNLVTAYALIALEMIQARL